MTFVPLAAPLVRRATLDLATSAQPGAPVVASAPEAGRRPSSGATRRAVAAALRRSADRLAPEMRPAR